ncbi:hypothetical protein SeMB42_g00372 [Synchytrium endobioticum]|uniref:Uncharacterized protein n=1 Tax=Synchytrium endobioticum TaxID=286115 RepID=A0A507DRF9_9FUNG|nr:hypothetical protein SeMB42_g00372 [Synchytrium endobioticum]
MHDSFNINNLYYLHVMKGRVKDEVGVKLNMGLEAPRQAVPVMVGGDFGWPPPYRAASQSSFRVLLLTDRGVVAVIYKPL